jgi:hypothetical protein
MESSYALPQECVFWRFDKGLRFDNRLKFCLDVDFFIRAFSGSLIIHSSKYIGFFRLHPESKTCLMSDLCESEHRFIVEKYSKYRNKGNPLIAKIIILIRYYFIRIYAKIFVVFMKRVVRFEYKIDNYLGDFE